MKVLHVATGFPFKYSGGITNYVRALVHSQMESGHDVHVLAGGHVTEGLPYVTNLKSDVIKPFSLKLNQEDKQYSQQIIEACKGYDIVHFHMVLDFPSSLLTQLVGVIPKYVVSLHDYFLICPRIFMCDYRDGICHQVDINKCNNCCGVLDANDFARKVSSKLSIPLPRINNRGPEKRLAMIRKFLEGADMLLPVSNKVKEIYSNIIPDAKYKVLHIGNITANETPYTKKKNNKIIIGLMGTLSYIKGAALVERIIKKTTNPDVAFHFYGRADKKWLERLERHGLINKGTYSQDNLKDIISTINLGLVAPIWEDNAPQVVMEFLNLNTPVLATRRGGITDFVNHLANGYLFEPNDPTSFNEMIGWLNSLQREDIDVLASGIHKLKTPQQHASEIETVYLSL